MKDVSFRYKGRKFKIKAEKCNEVDKFFGLMFKSRENANALLFEFKKSTRIRLHSFFVFFTFAAIWLDNRGKVIEIKKIKPFTVAASPKRDFYKLLEIPLNRRYIKQTKRLFS